MAVVSALVFLSMSLPAKGDIISDLKDKITGKSSDIERLEQEIAAYQKQLDQTSKEKTTLQSSVKTLDVTQKKLEKDINLTQGQIENTGYKIQATGFEIQTKQSHATESSRAIGEMMRNLNELDQASMIEVILSNASFSEFWGRITEMGQLQGALQGHITDLKVAQVELEKKKAEQQAAKDALARYQSELDDRKKIVAANKSAKNQLLIATKSQESNYKKILAQKLALKNAFEKELNDYESQLRAVINPNLLPEKGSHVLSWPLASIVLTQTFGDTEFARSGAYSGGGHNGVDFGTPVGTKVFAAASGVVEGVGDTDTVCKGASYGKWVFIRHQNGLASTYGHLSLIKAVTGQTVAAGDLIGYSGNTGYSTGPHLHLSVYASQAVSVQSRKSKVCGGTYTMPIAALNAYLDPMDYLPAR